MTTNESDGNEVMTRTLPQVIQDALNAAPDLYVANYDLRVRVEGWIDMNILATYIRDAFTLRTVEHLNAAPASIVPCESEFGAISKDATCWYEIAAGDDIPAEDLESYVPTLMMPWQWHGEGEDMRAVFVPTPVEAES